MRVRQILLLCMILCCYFHGYAQNRGEENQSSVDYINVYQKYLSGLKNTRCSMYPSCSNYAKMVFQDNSFPIAFVLTADRLIRCGHDVQYYPKSFVYGFHTAVDMPPGHEIPSGIVYQPINPVFVPSSIANNTFDFNSSGLISYMINEGNYQGALHEIDKIIYSSTIGSYINPELYAYKLRCYEGLNRYGDGILAFEQRFPVDCRQNYYVTYEAAHLYDLIGDTNNAVRMFESAREISPASLKANPLGELGILYAKSGQYGKAKQAFQDKYSIDGNQPNLNSNLALLEKLENTPKKNPIVAMALSVIPGAGYLYTGQPKNALSALIINGILAYSTYTSFRSKNTGVGIILGALDFSFYLGNIVGSGSSAKRYNLYIQNTLIEQLCSNNPLIF